MNSLSLFEDIRFDPDGFCRAIALDQVIQFFLKEKVSKEKLITITNTYKTLEYLDSLELNYNICIPKISLLSPFVWKILELGRNRVFFRISSFQRSHKNHKKKAVLYHLTCHQLYSIKETWSHCVCEFFEDNKRVYCDSYKNIFEREYPDLIYSEPNHERLTNMISTKIVIWND